MPKNAHFRHLNERRKKIEHIEHHLIERRLSEHLVSMYKHQRFQIFKEEVIKKYLKAKDIWYRFVLMDF
jgi:hypothetical protein